MTTITMTGGSPRLWISRAPAVVLGVTVAGLLAFSISACTKFRALDSDAATDAASDVSTDLPTGGANDGPGDRPDGGTAGAANGQPCTFGTTCSSGVCAESVCCDKTCGGLCMSCRSARTVSSPEGTCAAVASGQGDIQGRCAAASCSGGSFTPAATCDGAGQCATATARSCDPYVCGGMACKTMCTMSADCSAANYCASPSCVAKKGIGSVCAGFEECMSAICGGRCCNAACTCPQPSANNLFAQNAGFDSDLTGWGTTGLQWSSQDADGCTFSGSALMFFGSGNPSRCVAVTPGAFYNIGGMFRNTDSNLYICNYTTFAGAGCTGATGVSGSFNGSNPAWGLQIVSFQVPASNVSLMFTCDGNANTYVDKLYLSPDGY
jgi:hypothetical protein